MQDESSPSKGLRDRNKLKRTQKVATQVSSIPTQKENSDKEDYEEEKKPERPKREAKKVNPRPVSKNREETDQDPVSQEDQGYDPNAASEDELDGLEGDLDQELDPEDDDGFILPVNPKPRSKSRKKVKNENGIKTEEGDDEEEKEDENEGDENVFIDNLPKDENSIRVLLKEVNKHIRELERQFFEEEDSEVEGDIKNIEFNSAEEHNQHLEKIKEKSHIQQFWTIPLSDNVTQIDFDKFAGAMN
jgi:hypothetical protein